MGGKITINLKEIY